ncbi:MAG: membrane protein insertase YidC [Planctomycetota bacterium]|jgi:YidC/Oxa1 family membrane protein insertase
MGKRILTIALWGLVAVFIMNTCFPGDEPVETGTQAEWLESFEVPAPAEYPLILENEMLRSEWSATGASCGRVLLKQFTADLHEGEVADSDWLVVYDATWVEEKAGAGSSNYRRRDAFRLLETSDFLLPGDPETRVKQNLDSVEWQADFDAARNQITFTWESPASVTVTKTVRLDPDVYHFDAEVGVIPHDQVCLGRDLSFQLSTGGGIRVTADNFYPNPFVGVGLREYKQLEDVDFLLPSGKPMANRGSAERWTDSGIPFVVEGSKYFVSGIEALGNRGFSGAVAEVLFDDLKAGEAMERGDGESVRISSQSEFWNRASVAGGFVMHLSALETAERQQFRWYFGPKDTRILTSSMYGEMSEIIHYADYGRSFFYRLFLTSYVAPIILWIMAFFHGIVGNWGIAIILLTVVVKAAVFPIMRHSQVKMAMYQAKMAKVKPQIDAINKKYKDNPQQKNQETMKLYQQHKLSPPIGGCLPMFLQMPIFVGLFQALRSSILIRQEPFMLWIDDLSKPDALIDFGGPILGFWPFSGITTFNLLPLIMVVLWVTHQRSMPKPTDPQQAQMQKMMAFMPILFGLILYNYAAGLSLYMITSSAIGIFEQQVIRKRWPVPGSPQAKAMAEKAGGGS